MHSTEKKARKWRTTEEKVECGEEQHQSGYKYSSTKTEQVKEQQNCIKSLSLRKPRTTVCTERRLATALLKLKGKFEADGNSRTLSLF